MEQLIYGYVRVSTKEQNEDRQVVAMQEYGIKDSELMEQLLDEIDEYMEKPLVETLTQIQEKTVKAKDSLGNKITVPAGFKVLTSEGTRVQDGIVIQDEDENEFVWVPVSNINGDNQKVGRLGA